MRALLLLVIAACAKPPAPVTSNVTCPPVAPRVVPTEPCATTVPWLDDVIFVEYSEDAYGHFGWASIHVALQRYDDDPTFHGMVTITYRDQADAAPAVKAQAIQLPVKEVTGLITAMRAEIQTPEIDEEIVRMTNAGLSLHMSIKATGHDPPREGDVELFTNEGQTQPQHWHIRGCTTRPPLAARRATQQLVERFQRSFGRDALLNALGASY